MAKKSPGQAKASRAAPISADRFKTAPHRTSRTDESALARPDPSSSKVQAAESLADTQSAHGKDAKLVRQVQASHKGGNDRKDGAAFDPRIVGKKSVFRPILMSPYRADWPEVKSAVAKVLLYTFIEHVTSEEVRVHIVPRTAKSRGVRRGKQSTEQEPTVPSGSRVHPFTRGESGLHEEERSGILCGLNSVTRALEDAIGRTLQQREGCYYTPELILVCQADVDPAGLTGHLPMLVATLNAASSALRKDGSSRLATLVRLPAGSEVVLADALGLRRCAAVSLDLQALLESAISTSAALQETVRKFVDDVLEKLQQANVTPMRLAWLESAIATAHNTKEPFSATYLEPRIKHVHTSAPADMNTIKQERRSKRLARKQHKKDRTALQKKRRSTPAKSRLIGSSRFPKRS